MANSGKRRNGRLLLKPGRKPVPDTYLGSTGFGGEEETATYFWAAFRIVVSTSGNPRPSGRHGPVAPFLVSRQTG